MSEAYYAVHKAAGWAAVVDVQHQNTIHFKTRDHALADTAAWMANASAITPSDAYDLAEEIFYDSPL